MTFKLNHFSKLGLLGLAIGLGTLRFELVSAFEGPQYKTYKALVSIPKSTVESPRWYVVASSFSFNSDARESLSNGDLKVSSSRLQLDSNVRNTISTFYSEFQSMSSSYSSFTGEYIQSDPYVRIRKNEGLICVASDGSLTSTVKTPVSLPVFIKPTVVSSSDDGSYYVHSARTNSYQWYPDNTVFCSNQGSQDVIRTELELTFLTPYAVFGETRLSSKQLNEFFSDKITDGVAAAILDRQYWNIRSIVTDLNLNRLAGLSEKESLTKDDLKAFAENASLAPNTISIDMEFSKDTTKTIKLPATIAKGSFVEVYQKYYWGAASKGLVTLPLATDTEKSKKKLKKYQEKREQFLDQDAAPMAFTCKVGSQAFVDSSNSDMTLDVQTEQDANELRCSLNVPKKHGKLVGQANIQIKILERSSLDALSKSASNLKVQILDNYASKIERDRAAFLKNYFESDSN